MFTLKLFVSVIALHAAEPTPYQVLESSKSFMSKAECTEHGLRMARVAGMYFEKRFRETGAPLVVYSVGASCEANGLSV